MAYTYCEAARHLLPTLYTYLYLKSRINCCMEKPWCSCKGMDKMEDEMSGER